MANLIFVWAFFVLESGFSTLSEIGSEIESDRDLDADLDPAVFYLDSQDLYLFGNELLSWKILDHIMDFPPRVFAHILIFDCLSRPW